MTPADRYEPGDEEPPPICTEEIVESLARWIEDDTGPELPEEVKAAAAPSLHYLI